MWSQETLSRTADGTCHRHLAAESSEPGVATPFYKGGHCFIESFPGTSSDTRVPEPSRADSVPNAGGDMAPAREEGASAAKLQPALHVLLCRAHGTVAEWAESIELLLPLFK